MRDIIHFSNSIHVISNDDYNLWKGVLEFRNCIVHNNAFASKTETYNFPSIKPGSFTYPELKLHFKKGEAVESSSLLFPHVLNWTTDSIKDWIYRIHNYNKD